MISIIKQFLEYNLVTVIVVLGSFVYLKDDFGEYRKTARTIRVNMLLVLLLSVFDTVELWTANYTDMISQRILCSALGYSLRPVVILMLIFIIVKERNKRIILSIPGAFNVIVAFSAFFTDIAYSYNTNNVFVRGPLGFTTHAVCFFYLIVLIVVTAKYFKEDSEKRRLFLFTSIFIAVLIVVCSVIDIPGKMNSVIAIGNMYYFMYYYINLSVEKAVENTREVVQKKALERLAYIDALTELGNRAAFSRMMSECANVKNMSCVVFDVNNLKLCNDRYGHSEGDKMITDAAGCISDAFRDIGNCFRIGGDEFSVLIQNKTEKDILASVDKMNSYISEKNAQRIMPLSIAFGYAVREGKNENIEHLFNRSDERMYEMKYRMKKEFPVYCEERIKNYLNVLEILSKSTDDYLFLWNIVSTNELYFMGSNCEKYVDCDGALTRITLEDLNSIVYEEDISLIQNDLKELMEGVKKIHNLNYRWISRKGEVVWINCRGRVIDDDKGKPFVMIGRVSETEMNLLINPLTGLFNKIRMMEELKNKFDSGEQGYLMIIDIDNMGDINIKFGREFGDNLLKGFAKILDKVTKVRDIYHIEHDCFGVFLNVKTEKEVYRIYDEMQKEIAGRYTISVGVVPNNNGLFVDENNLFDCAKQTLDKSKKDGKNTISLFSKEDMQHRIADIELFEELKESVNNDFSGFSLCYQPQVKAGNYNIYAAEALLRYNSPVRGRVFPDQFIYILEKSRLINKVGLWVLEKALLQCRQWRETINDIHISVNFSTVQLEEPDVVEKVLDILDKTGMSGSALTIEITESIQLQEIKHFSEIFEAWKKAGIDISIDDFGTGYSNMGYLKQLNVDEIKIDKMFINQIDEGTYNYRLINNMIEFARMNSIRICCEGVENMHELAVLEGLSPNLLQGYLFDKPCESKDFDDIYINENSTRYKERLEFINKLYNYKKQRHVIHFNPKDILRITDVGLWIIRINDNKQRYEMHADETMERVMGIDRRYTPQECYNFWYDRIKDGYYDYVQKNVNLMTEIDKVVQLEYPWIHPDFGEVMVRCCGRRVEDSDGMIVLEGYHRIISTIEAGK